jgi:membrane protease YdiL (CAAX protease family)
MEPARAQHEPVFTASQALGLFVFVVAALLIANQPLVRLGLAGIVVAQVLAFGGIPALAAWLRFGAAAPAALGLRRPEPRALAGAACVGASFWYISLSLIVPLTDHLGGKDDLAHLETMVAETPLWLVLVGMAALPAICEELFMRGLVARALASSLGRAGAILGSAGLFALLHASPTRFLPMVCFGVILAHVTLTTGSVVPSMVMHAINNVIALLLTTERWPDLTAAMEANAVVFLAGAVVICVVGLALLNRMHQNPE